MGLEAINFFFCSDESIKETLSKNKGIEHIEGKKYVYRKSEEFWIDLEIQNESCISIRITLCNPEDNVLKALDSLLCFLFQSNGSVLSNLNTKELFKEYNNEVKRKIMDSYFNRQKVFQEMYGSFTAAINSEEFYRIQREKRN